MKKNIKAVTIGDIKGIGIKLLLNLIKLKNKNINNFVLITNDKLFKKYLTNNKIKLTYNVINKPSELKKITKNNLIVYNISAENDIINTYNSIKTAYFLTKKKLCGSIITLPLNKEKIIKKINKSFKGHTELLEKLDNKEFSNMVFYSKKIIVSTLTTHIPINKINLFLKKKNIIYRKITSLNKMLITDFNIKNPKIIISGLNPHAGENGKIGNEEKKYINPIINKLQINNINIKGPFSADTIFNKINISKFDCFVCIYHDQALIPFKLITEMSGVNFTGSLDIIRTSPTHGTAYNLINIENADNTSLINSFILADKIYKNRLRKKIVKT